MEGWRDGGIVRRYWVEEGEGRGFGCNVEFRSKVVVRALQLAEMEK